MEVIASVFESEGFLTKEAVVPFKELYPSIKNYLTNFCSENGIIYDGEKEITFNNTKITFYLYYSPKIRRYFLCVIPKNIWEYSNKNVLLLAFNETLDFFKKLPDSMDICDVNFKKSSVTGKIDISDWSFTTKPDVGGGNIMQITSTSKVKQIGASIYSKKQHTIKYKLLIIDSGGIIGIAKRDKIKEKIAPLFEEEPQIITYKDSILETIETRTDKDNLFVLFFGNKKSIDECYTRYKKYFISQGIPSQFVGIENVDKILKWGLENLMFEILKKTQEEDAISLDMLPSIDIDGFLCLSDIDIYQNNKFFGIGISFTGSGETEDWLEIYDDVNYSTKFETITFQEGELTKLGIKIKALSNLSGKTINVITTKNWNVQDVEYLSKILEKNDIKVRKFLYVGSKSNRFLFSSLVNENDMLYQHPFIIWDDKAASVQTNSRIQLYGTMFPLYIELLNPRTGEKLTEDDLKTILWLVKKRIYRIANFYSLKTPELLALFEQVKGLDIKNIPGRLRISLHTLI